MIKIHPNFITDKTGKKISVVLSMEEFEKMIDELDELEDLRLYDEAKEDTDEGLPFEEVVKMIKDKRKKAEADVL